MNLKNKKIRFLILTLVLMIISFIYILIKGQTYNITIELNNNFTLDNMEIVIDNPNIIECVDKKIVNEKLYLTFKSISKGKSFVDIKIADEYIDFFKLYVHNFGIITFEDYFGNSNGGYILNISFIIMIIYLLYILTKKFIYNYNQNMYQNKNITYIGIIIGTTAFLIELIRLLFNYRGIISTIQTFFDLSNSLAFYLLPIAFILSILVTISNIVLVKKEGLNYRNLLGLILSVCFLVMTILPEFMYRILFNAKLGNFSNLNEPDPYIYLFFEQSIYLMVAYIECILIGTIIMGINCAKHIPKFNKDYIIILGCQIRKDGSLTPLLKSRVDRAITFRNMQKEKTGKDLTFIASGGKGYDEIIAEGEAIKNYLIEQGINEKNILVDDKSKNTYENIKYSYKLIQNRKSNLAISTTNYHVFRAGLLATEQNIQIEGIGSKTKAYFWINAFIREFIAAIYTEKKKHILIFIILDIILILMLIIFYLSNNI